jgi:hypothetical protein
LILSTINRFLNWFFSREFFCQNRNFGECRRNGSHRQRSKVGLAFSQVTRSGRYFPPEQKGGRNPVIMEHEPDSFPFAHSHFPQAKYTGEVLGELH